MLRHQQILEDFIQQFVAENGSMPTDTEINAFIASTSLYAPLTKPMVPLKNAPAVASYVSDTLKSMLKDRQHLAGLVNNLQTKAERATDSTKFEVQAIDNKVSNILNTQKDNSFKTLYNEVPELLDAGDMEDTLLWASSVADLYLIDDETQIQSILLNSHNIKKGPEGISLIKSSEKIINASILTSLYSTSPGTTMNLLSDLNPISAVITGSKGKEKGLKITLGISQQFVSEVFIDVNPCTAEIILTEEDDDTADITLFTKTLDGPSTLSIHKHIKNSIIINLYGEAARVYINVKEITVSTSSYSAQGSYGKGRYIAADLNIDRSYGGLLFKPDEHIPTGTSIDWEYSSDTIEWKQLEKTEQGTYLPLDWNRIDKIYEPDSAEIDGSKIKLLEPLPYSNPKDVKLSAGKGALMFVTKQLIGYYAFMGYITPADETGYTLNLYNPSIDESNRLFGRIAITSDSFNHDELPEETISIDIPAGTHKLTIELFQNNDFNLDNLRETDNEGNLQERDSYENILKILREEYLIDITLAFDTDLQGRSADLAIQPFSLNKIDADLYNYLDEKSKINAFSIDNDSYIHLNKLKTSSQYYDVLLFNDIYLTNVEETITAELHAYAGDGSEDFNIDVYYLPETVNSVFTPGEANITTDITWDGKTATLPGSPGGVLPDTTQNSAETFNYSGEEEASSTTLSYHYNQDTLLLTSYNFNKTDEVFSDTQNSSSDCSFVFYEKVQARRDADSTTYNDPNGTDLVADLSRKALASDNVKIVWDDNAAWGTTFTEISILIDEDTSLIDIEGHGYSAYDDIWVKYSVAPDLGVTNDTNLEFSNLPDASQLHKKITQNIEVSAAYMTDTASFILMDGEQQTEIAPPRIKELTLTVTDSENPPVVKTDKIITAAGNEVVADLSEYFDESSAALYTVTLEFHALASDRELIIEYTYDYYETRYFKFSYDYIREQVAKVEEIYNNSAMLEHFYDISYYITSEEDDPEQDIKLHLMAHLEGNSSASPIIRRLIFERQ